MSAAEAGSAGSAGSVSEEGRGAGGAGDALAGLSFEELVEQLEVITRRMAAGDIGIEAVTDLYEHAGRLHAEASARLEAVRERIEKLGATRDT